MKESCHDDKVFHVQTHSSAVPPDVHGDVDVPSTMNDLNEDIAHVRQAGLMGNDNREPAPKNMPTASNHRKVDPTTALYCGQRWNWDGQCQRKLVKETMEKPSFHDGWMPEGPTKILHDFTKFFSIMRFINVVIARTSNNLQEAGEQGTNKGEMFTYVGYKLLMATVVGFTQHQFFSVTKFDKETNPCPYQLTKFMAAC